MSDTWTIYTDGGSRGNPGPAAYAYVIKRPGHPDIEEKAFLGKTTNNIAEYTGLIKALEHAQKLAGKKLLVNSDSELMVKQLNGQYRVKNEGLKPLYEQAVKLRKHFDSVTIKHIYRDQNSQADALCNEAMDDRSPTEPDLGDLTPGEPAPGEPSRISGRVEVRLDPQPAAPDLKPTSLMRALALMKKSATRWAETGDPTNPPPVDVLNEILEMIQPELAD